MKILVLGATGMLGNAMMRVFGERDDFDLSGSVRSTATVNLLPPRLQKAIIPGVDVENPDQLAGLFDRVRPDVVVNCVGIVKQLEAAEDPLTAIPINALLPHRLARLASLSNARLIHFSTDCVFSGARGGYVETDVSDAYDLYGRSKFLGEVAGAGCLTVRTSIIGHELTGRQGLVEWFLSQSGVVNGYTRAIFSGLPTVALSKVVRDVILPKEELSGVWHVGSDPVSKYDLLKLVASAYGRDLEIVPVDAPVIDRSLDSSRFRSATGYVPPSWPELVDEMRAFG